MAPARSTSPASERTVPKAHGSAPPARAGALAAFVCCMADSARRPCWPPNVAAREKAVTFPAGNVQAFLRRMAEGEVIDRAVLGDDFGLHPARLYFRPAVEAHERAMRLAIEYRARAAIAASVVDPQAILRITGV